MQGILEAKNFRCSSQVRCAPVSRRLRTLPTQAAPLDIVSALALTVLPGPRHDSGGDGLGESTCLDEMIMPNDDGPRAIMNAVLSLSRLTCPRASLSLGTSLLCKLTCKARFILNFAEMCQINPKASKTNLGQSNHVVSLFITASGRRDVHHLMSERSAAPPILLPPTADQFQPSHRQHSTVEGSSREKATQPTLLVADQSRAVCTDVFQPYDASAQQQAQQAPNEQGEGMQPSQSGAPPPAAATSSPSVTLSGEARGFLKDQLDAELRQRNKELADAAWQSLE